jgi:hypothetical protein
VLQCNYRLLARSRTRLAHVPVGSPFRAAASSYAFLRLPERRNSSRSFSGSSMGGLPRFGAFMGGLYARTNILTSAGLGHILSVHLIRRQSWK